MSKYFRSVAVGGLFLFAFGACSAVVKRQPSPELRATVVSVAANYLRQISVGNLKNLNTLVLWADYLPNAKPDLTKQGYISAIQQLQHRWRVQDHPLLGLDIVSVEIEGEDAEVTLQKAKVADAEQIIVKLAWNGSGWLVVDDSLFGKGKQIEQWLAGGTRAG